VSGPDLQGAGQTVSGDVFEVRYSEHLPPGPPDPQAARYLGPESFIESDAPEIVAEARKATGDAAGPREKAERLVRYVNALLEKKPTISLPSALEVLRTKVGDCNEHTVLYVAMARAVEIPSRVAVGLVFLRGAFYYHAWPEVYLEEPDGRGVWIAVDPTLNQFAADATHVRLARGGLDRQAAILPVVGRAKAAILDFQMRPGTTPILVGREAPDSRPFEIALPRKTGSRRDCWSNPR
jgi:transglutaminase-like putative cysteine protease